MAKAANKSSTNKNPDAEIFEISARLKKLDREHLKLDKIAVRRSGAESDEADDRMLEIAADVDEMCWRIVHDVDAATAEGHAEKVDILLRTGFFELDPDVVFGIVWAIGYEAGRLGLKDAPLPTCCKRIFTGTVRAAEAAWRPGQSAT
jgi:hypothetical protein